MRVVVSFAAGALFASLTVGSIAQAAEGLTPHQATYSLSVVRSTALAGVDDAYGELTIRRSITCSSVAESQNLRATFVFRGEQSMREQGVETFEKRDGSLFRVTVRDRASNGGWRERRMQAERLTPEGPIDLTFDDQRVGAAPAETIFPAALTASALRAAAAEEPRLEALLFDGAAPDALTVSIDIGRPTVYAGGHRGDSLRHETAWPLRSAYYARESALSAPLLTMEAVVDADGVMREAILPLSPVALRATLSSLDFSPPPDC